ncbi:MAG: ABC transporter permease, partial [Acidobacteriota bacterium]|nr:ABC transporter permease [Acidobacteriota bacterium]
MGRQRLERSLHAELQAYIDDSIDRNIASGLSPLEARRQALAGAEGIEQIKEEVRQVWFGHALETTIQDIRYACRGLLRSPGFTVVVAATLALGIGASLTMFSLMRAVLWRPLPYPDPARIITIEVDARNVRNAGASEGELADLRLRSRSLEQVSTIGSVDANLELGGDMEHVTAASVSDDLLPLIGVQPELGRLLNSGTDLGNNQVLAVMIGDELWRTHFAADPHAVGRAVRIDNLDVQIVGVMPKGFRLFLGDREQIDVWFPLTIGTSRRYRGASIFARLKPGVTIEQANAEFATLAAEFAREYPDAYRFASDPASLRRGVSVRFTAHPLQEEMTRNARPALLLLASAVAFVLLIACSNAANLMLARGLARRRDLAIRCALGAGRLRVVRQLLTESLILALFSSAIGLFCARFGLEVIAHFRNSHIPLQSRIGIDGSVMAFALALSAVTSVLFGMLPAWRLASGKTSDPLRSGRTESAGAGARRLHRCLVVAEVALSIVPIACGGLMLRSFLNLTHAPLGFDPTRVVTAKAPVSLREFPETPQRWAWLSGVLGRVRAIPGVESASAASPLPLAPDQETRRVGRDDQPEAPPILATQQIAAPGYLKTMGSPLLQGRDFDTADITSDRAVTIVDQRLARRLWPEGAIGKRLSVWRSAWRQDLEVIGVIADVRATSVRVADAPHFMMPYNLYPIDMSLVVKTRESAERIAPEIRRAVAAAHGGRAAFDIRPMSTYVADSIGGARFVLFVLAAFACTSLLLAAVGLYGTLAYLTAQRTREFGIRLALGSSVKSIVAIVMREGALLSSAGAALGLAGAAASTRAIGRLLYGVKPLDTLTLLGVIAAIGLVALGASAIPAWRA